LYFENGMVAPIDMFDFNALAPPFRTAEDAVKGLPNPNLVGSRLELRTVEVSRCR
jgi:hypothetical protein